MKKGILLLLILAFIVPIYAQRDWKAYTNTSYIFSITKGDNNLILSTWGGLQFFDNSQKVFGKTMTTLDNLSENFIRDAKYSSEGNFLYVGTNTKGVDRYKNMKKTIPINEVLGLISGKINKITLKDSLIFIATKDGLSIFYNNSQNSFPILIKNFDTSNGLSSNNITSMAIFNNTLYCGSIGGLDFINLDSLSVVPAPWHNLNSNNSMLDSDVINDISASNDFIAVATQNGLFCFNEPLNHLSWRKFESDNSIFPVAVIDSLVFYSLGYWNEDELQIVKDNDDFSYYTLKNPFGDAQIYHYTEDDVSKMIMGFKKFDDGYYIYTWGDGLYYSQDLSSWTQYMPNCPVSNSVFRVKLDKSDNLWLSSGHHGVFPTATGTKGISRFDGVNWTNYSMENSPLISDNIISIAVDNDNDVWFGTRYTSQGNPQGWKNGISILKQNSCLWDTLDVFGNFIMDMYYDKDKSEMWVTCYDNGVAIIDKNFDEIARFSIYGSYDQKVVKTLPAMGKVFFGFWFDGIKYWDDSSLPDYDVHEKWVEPQANELKSGKIYDIAYRVSKYGEQQVWFASANGLFMFNSENWYWYGPIQKKRVLVSSNNWEPDNLDQQEYHTPEYWYVVGQERLYGSAITYPTALFVDPFGSIWIGTQSHGITRFYPDKDIYINYYVENSPLLSNTINDFAYDEKNGVLYIATSQGLNSVYIGKKDENNTITKLHKTKAFPNPFSPYKGQILRIETSGNMPKGKTYCKIYDLNANEIIKLSKNDYLQFEWNGKNKAGDYCAPGIYFYVVYTENGQIDKNKFVIVR